MKSHEKLMGQGKDWLHGQCCQAGKSALLTVQGPFQQLFRVVRHFTCTYLKIRCGVYIESDQTNIENSARGRSVIAACAELFATYWG